MKLVKMAALGVASLAVASLAGAGGVLVYSYNQEPFDWPEDD